MKKAIAVVAGLLAAVAAYAQGSVNFVNFLPGSGIDAPVYLGNTTTGAKLDGTAYLAQLWGGPAGGTLAASGDAVPFRSGAGAGYWNAGANSARSIGGVPEGANADLEVRVWAKAVGDTWEQAVAAKMDGYGTSAKLTIKTGGAPGSTVLPADLVGLTSFAITPVVPEPSVLALGALGAGLLLLRRKK